jgi:hypothetical protein
MGIKFTNNASATLAASINSTVTSLSVTTGQGSRFPTLLAGDYFYATLVDSSNNIEIIKVTNRVTDTMTVVRAQDGTIGRSFLANDRIELRPVAAAFTALQEFTPSGTISANTLAGAIVELDSEKAALASPAFTGTPTVPTATAGTNTTQAASTAFVTTAITNERSATVAITNKTISGSNNTITNVSLTSGVTGTLPVANGGTGSDATYTNGQLLIGNSTGNTLAKATLTAGTGISITNGAGSITVAAAEPNVQTFNSPGTWNKPSTGTMARIQVWGGGGGGGAADFGPGGGGGGYNELWIPLSSLAASVSVTIGGGGAAGGTTGVTGGTSSFGTLVLAYGGGGGGYNSISAYGSGGGGSQLSAGQPANGTGQPGASRNWDGGVGASHQSIGSYGAVGIFPASSSIFGGGGGASLYGGSVAVGAVSLYGGNGATNTTAAQVPGGGGRGQHYGTATAGAAGRVIVTVF